MIKKIKNNKLNPDLIIDFFITGRCDMNCQFCYGADIPCKISKNKETNSQCNVWYKPTNETINITGKNILRSELNFKQLTKILTIFANLGLKKINIGGGEPLLRTDTPKIIEFANKLGISVYLSTNATFLKSKYEEIKDNIKVLGLPLDGSTIEINTLMGRAPYLMNNIKSTLEYFNKNKPNHVVKVGTIISKINIEDMEKIGSFLYETPGIYKPDIWRIYQFEKIERGENNAELYEINNEDFLSKIKFLKERFPQVKIAPRSNTEHNNAYFFISPDGMLQLVDNKHRSILDISVATEKDIYKKITKFKNTIKKTENNRKWIS